MPVNTFGIVTDGCYCNELITFVQINFYNLMYIMLSHQVQNKFCL